MDKVQDILYIILLELDRLAIFATYFKITLQKVLIILE